MTIAYSSAYVQTKTLHFTFARGKLILCILMPNAEYAAPNVGHDNGVIRRRRAACGNRHFACVKCYIFVHFSSTPSSILKLLSVE